MGLQPYFTRMTRTFVVLTTLVVVIGWPASSRATQTIYASSLPEGVIYKIDSSGNKSIFASGLGQPWGLATDDQGNVFVAETSGNPSDRITKIDPSGVATLFFEFDEARDNPEGLALRDDGTLFVSGTIDDVDGNNTPNDLLAISPDGVGSKFGLIGTQENPGVAINDNGTLFVTEINSQRGGVVWEGLPTGASSPLIEGIGTPFGIAVGPDGSVFIAVQTQIKYLGYRDLDQLSKQRYLPRLSNQ